MGWSACRQHWTQLINRLAACLKPTGVVASTTSTAVPWQVRHHAVRAACKELDRPDALTDVCTGTVHRSACHCLSSCLCHNSWYENRVRGCDSAHVSCHPGTVGSPERPTCSEQSLGRSVAFMPAGPGPGPVQHVSGHRGQVDSDSHPLTSALHRYVLQVKAARGNTRPVTASHPPEPASRAMLPHHHGVQCLQDDASARAVSAVSDLRHILQSDPEVDLETVSCAAACWC